MKVYGDLNFFNSAQKGLSKTVIGQFFWKFLLTYEFFEYKLIWNTQ